MQMSRVKSGDLRHRLTVQEPPTERDKRGRRDKDAAWSQVGKLWGNVKTLSGDEREIARQLVAQATHRVTVRRPRQYSLESTHRFLFRGRVFSIGFIDDVDELGAELVCICNEVKP